MSDDALIEAMAMALCVSAGKDPDRLEPGDGLGIDGYNRKGDPCHFFWKEYTTEATAALAALRKTHAVMPVDRVRKLLEYSDSEYVPNGIFDEFRAMLNASEATDA